MNDKNQQAASTDQQVKGIPDINVGLRENTDAIDRRAVEQGEGDRTDTPDMYELSNEEHK